MPETSTNSTGTRVNIHPAPAPQEDTDGLVQGLTPAEIRVLAQKVYDLLLDELRLEVERHGQRVLR